MKREYTLRNEHGVLIASLTAKDAGGIIQNASGHWREARFRDGTVSNVYEIDAGFSVMLNNIKFFVWEGYLLRKELF